MKRNLLFSALIALLVSVLTIFGYEYFFSDKNGQAITIEHIDGASPREAVYTLNENGEVVPLDFTQTAEKVMDAVVHIRSTRTVAARQPSMRSPFGDMFPDDFFEEFFGPRGQVQPPNGQADPRVRMGDGSGVIVSQDGYIVTNNHVVANAEDIEVTLHDNRSYKASVVGLDPTTDLAVIKIEEKDLRTLAFVNSDEVKVGEWVLAVGNPFNLNSTVTAGIVSAKGRAINILREQYAIESFIQTDAAINPGNSGGALVNLQGGLIGINTAIASPTGAYSGYGFAVPANIVRKVVEDIIEYGTVQRGYLGIMIRSLDAGLAKAEGLDISAGVYVDSLMANSAAAEAGIQPGDVIVEIDGNPITANPELLEMVARKRPGDQLNIVVNRDGKKKTFEVTLNNREGNTELVKRERSEILSSLGLEVETLSKEAAKELGVDGGVRVGRLLPGQIRRQTQMREGFIITKVDGRSVRSVEELTEILENKTGGVMLEGRYEDQPGTFYYAFGLNQ